MSYSQRRSSRRLTGQVLWSRQADADLENIDPDLRNEIKRNAEETLPDIQPCTERIDQETWCHRGITHEQEQDVDRAEQEDVDGIQPWDYWLFFRELDPDRFEVLAVFSTHQIANMGGHAAWEPPPGADDEEQ